MGFHATLRWGAMATLACVTTGSACDSAGVGPSAACTPDSGRACVGALASPPPPGRMQPPDGTGTVTLAFKTLLIGEASPNGPPDANAWKQYGYNIDGVPPGNLAAFCMPAAGASASLVHEEGTNGIENAFGHLVWPSFQSSAILNCSLCNAPDPLDKFRPLLSLDELGGGSSYDPVSARVALGGDLGHAPLFDGTDQWPVVQGTTISLPTSYLVNDTWVSGTIGNLSLPLDLDPVVTFDIHHAVLTMKLDQARTTATGGILSGVIPTADLQQKAQMAVGTVDPGACSGPQLADVLLLIARSSDIMEDGTQDPAKTCDGISIGLGFEASLVQVGPSVAAAPLADPCAGDAGRD